LNENASSLKGVVPTLLISSISLITAGFFRMVVHEVVSSNFGDSLSTIQVIGVLLVDGGHISLILVALGGLGTIIFVPNTQE
jgi:hypothetical protein